MDPSLSVGVWCLLVVTRRRYAASMRLASPAAGMRGRPAPRRKSLPRCVRGGLPDWRPAPAARAARPWLPAPLKPRIYKLGVLTVLFVVEQR